MRITAADVPAMNAAARVRPAAAAIGMHTSAAMTIGPPLVSQSAFMLTRLPFMFTSDTKCSPALETVEAEESAAGKSQMRKRRKGTVTAPSITASRRRSSVRSRAMMKRATRNAPSRRIMNGA